MLGFEYGFSLGAAGTALVIWEAQFGDFANNAQAIIDQYVAAGARKSCLLGRAVLRQPHAIGLPVCRGRAASWQPANPFRWALQRRSGGASALGLCSCCRMGMTARAPTTPQRASSASCS